MRDQCLQEMKMTLTQTQTNNLAKETTQKGIVNWILQPCCVLQPPRQRHNNKLTKLLTEAVQEQNEIGWNNFMKGRTSQTWGEAQQVHHLEKQKALKTEKEKQEAKHNTGELFQMRLIVETFRMFETLWEAQNQDFHKNTTGQNDKSLREQ